MTELIVKSFPETFGPTCNTCLAPMFGIFEKYSHIMYQFGNPENKIKEFSEAVRLEIFQSWKDFITIKSKGLFNPFTNHL
jgi:hypothetical protein